MEIQKLKGLLLAKGLTYEDVAKILNISSVAFFKKINGKTEFKRDEIKILSETLKLSENEMVDIFFKS